MPDTKITTLNQRLQREEGLEFWGYWHQKDTQTPERIAAFAVECARGDYEDFRIVPGNLALEGCEWRFKEPIHLLYVKLARQHPNSGTPHIVLASPTLIHRATGEEKYNCPVHTL